ncbi:MAG: antibiotic biosynthesis monooxygenase [Flavobacteriales bacterium]|nr:antibiotic biosynthesis monooxygenase [Flavobacteriales bacterium]
MFVAIYQFTAKEGQVEVFIEAWEQLTELIYQYEGSLGSHLHRSTEDPLHFIAYAQWPDQQTWETSGGNMPETANKWREQMRNACVEIKTLHAIESVKNLTRDQRFK